MNPKLIMLDTDIGPDCDDAAALALLNMYADKGWCQVLSVTHCTSSPYGVGAIRAINQWYGHDYPVGTMKRRGFLVEPQCLRYSKALSETVAPSLRDAGDAVSLMRDVLARQANQSVHLVAIGPLRNIADLLDADEALVNRKCASFTLMAGCFPPRDYKGWLPQVEWNIEMDVDAAHTVFDKWHGKTTLCGWECGVCVPCGGPMREKLPPAHPVRMAYQLHNKGEDRPSWDLLTVRHACVPEAYGTAESVPGQITLSDKGETSFTPDPQGRFHIVEITGDPAVIAEELNDYLCKSGEDERHA